MKKIFVPMMTLFFMGNSVLFSDQEVATNCYLEPCSYEVNGGPNVGPYAASNCYVEPCVVNDCCQDPWTGGYVGFNAGWGWSRGAFNIDPFGSNAIFEFSPHQTQGNRISGGLFGGQLGMNWKLRSFIVGAEGDFDVANISHTRTSIFQSPFVSSDFDGITTSLKIEWLGSIRARLGIACGCGFIYVTGGGAWTQVKAKTLLSASTDVFTSGGSDFRTTKAGWVAGGGLERKVSPRWSVKAEYLHYHFGKGPNTIVELDVFDTGNGANVSVGNTIINAVRLGVNYSFDLFRCCNL